MATQDPIRITKYTNRRLYDATNSRHLTLDQLIQLVRKKQLLLLVVQVLIQLFQIIRFQLQ